MGTKNGEWGEAFSADPTGCIRKDNFCRFMTVGRIHPFEIEILSKNYNRNTVHCTG